MVSFDGCVDIILDIIKEAKDRKYPDHVLKYDLSRYLKSLYEDQESLHDNDLEWARDEAYDEGKEDGYSDGYDDGVSDGKAEFKEAIMGKLADEVIKLKEFIRDTSCTKKEIQLKITEMLVELDEDEVWCYLGKGKTIEEIDAQCEEI